MNIALGLLLPFLGTTLGAACVYLLKDKLNKNIINILHNLGVDLTYPTTSVYIEKQ